MMTTPRSGAVDGAEPQLKSAVKVSAVPLDGARFAEFGEVLAPRPRDRPDFIGYASIGWEAPLYVSGRPQLLILRTPFVGFRVPLLERHSHITQVVVPLTRVPAVFVVAAPSTRPDPQDLRAFLIDGTCSYLLHRQTWHSPDRYPLASPGADYALLTEWETTGAPDGEETRARTEELVCREHFGADIEIVVSEREVHP